MIENLRAVLFDLDGTLVDSALGITSAINRLRDERGGSPVGPDLVRPLVSQGVDILLSHTLKEFAISANMDRAQFRHYLQAQPADPAMIYNGVTVALEILRSTYAMGVVTNKPAALASQLLADLDLARYFTVVIGGDSAAFPKPHRAPMDLAMTALKCVGLETIMIGDSYVDESAATAAGCAFVLYTSGYGPAEKRVGLKTFASFNELPAVLRVCS